MKHWKRIRRSLTTATIAAGAAAVALPANAQFAPPPPTGSGVGANDPFFGGFRPGFTFNPQQPPNGNGFSNTFNNPFANPFTSAQTGFGAFANPFTNANPFGGQFDPRFANGVVNPAFGSNFTGFDTFGNLVDPRLSGSLGGTALINPFTPAFSPGFGGVAAPSHIMGPLDVGAAMPPTAMTTARLPLLGINSPARTVGGLPPNLFANRRIGGSSTARTRTTRSQASAATQRSIDADIEARAATRMAQMMRTRPMVPGRVTRVGTNDVQVKLDNRRNTTRRYALSEVFFYRNDQLLDAASARSRLRKGDSVLVPDRAIPLS